MEHKHYLKHCPMFKKGNLYQFFIYSKEDNPIVPWYKDSQKKYNEELKDKDILMSLGNYGPNDSDCAFLLKNQIVYIDIWGFYHSCIVSKEGKIIEL